MYTYNRQKTSTGTPTEKAYFEPGVDFTTLEPLKYKGVRTQASHGTLRLKLKGIGEISAHINGDGYSDVCAIDETDLLFAKSYLQSYCEEENITHNPFDTFADISKHLHP